MDLKTWCAAERGRASTLAVNIGVPVPFMSQMVGGIRPVPPVHCFAIEQATAGQVSRQELRPDDWERIWPDLIGADGSVLAEEPTAIATSEAKLINRRKQTTAAPLACPEARLLGVIGDADVLAANAAIATVECQLSDLRERRGKERRGIAATGRDAKPSAAAEQGRAH